VCLCACKFTFVNPLKGSGLTADHDDLEIS
jgi:hypothetical protein